MRLFVSILATTAIFFMASTASALVTFTATATAAGGDLLNLIPGEEVTLDIRISSDGTPTFGMGASVWGYDEAVADFVSGENAASYLYETCIPTYGCFTGLTNLAGGAAVESAIGANGNRVQIANSAGLVGITGTGADDPGLDGVVAGGDAQFRILFTATGAGATTLNIGTGYQGDGIILDGGENEPAVGATIGLNVIPEPGTALLMGLGLAGLAAAGRRR
ncbi:MAG: hypothetical protein CL908_03970 [Deltaproteobacteria bacterium]|nr:hypothetical protein [Deltaproteobacteria bacterium]